MRRIPAAAGHSERHGRQHEVAQGAVAAERKPAQEVGEDIEQGEPDDELRRRDRDEGQRHRHLVGAAAAAAGGIDPGRDADHQLGQDGAEHKQQGGGKTGCDQVADIALAGVGLAEIADREASDISEILHRQRPVEAELVADLLASLGRGIAPGQHGHRIGRDHEGEGEGDHGHPDQDHEGCDEPSREIADHPLRSRWVGSRASRRPSPTRLKERARIRMAAPGMKTSQGALRK